MTSDLRPELLTPTPPYVWRLLLGSVAGAIGIVVMAVGSHTRTVPPVVSLALLDAGVETELEPEAVVRETAPTSSVGQLALVFQVDGASYMKLADLSGEAHVERMPRHGTPILSSSSDWIIAAIAPVAADDLSLSHRAWQGKGVTVDGTCRATVRDFAIVSRLSGTPDYAGGEGETWKAGEVMQSGSRVLAARLDGCTHGSYARDATLSPLVVPEVIDDAPLAQAARRAMLGAPETLAAQTEWAANQPAPGHWTKADGTVITARVLRHPTTGVTWVSVQGRYDGGCGAPNLNVWKLYRADRDGKLTPVPVKLDERATEVQQLIDIEGDGALEVITSTWLGNGRNVNRASGEAIAHESYEFFGCAC